MILDFSNMDSMEDVVAEVVECYGCVDVLIFNSSMKLRSPAQSVSLNLDRNVMDVNYFGPSTLAKGGLYNHYHFPHAHRFYLNTNMSVNVAGVLPAMISRRSGHIVLINSIQGRLAFPFRSSCESPIKVYELFSFPVIRK